MSTIEQGHPYRIDVHAQRFAAWAASRAAARGAKGLTVYSGSRILDCCGAAKFAHPDYLPNPSDIDEAHRYWCESACHAATLMGFTITHGVAAKLVNIYHKSRFVCAGYHDHPKVAALHPPVDSILMRALAIRSSTHFFQVSSVPAWSKFNAGEYQEVITKIRDYLDGKPMWMIEESWDPAAVAYPSLSGIGEPG